MLGLPMFPGRSRLRECCEGIKPPRSLSCALGLGRLSQVVVHSDTDATHGAQKGKGGLCVPTCAEHASSDRSSSLQNAPTAHLPSLTRDPAARPFRSCSYPRLLGVSPRRHTKQTMVNAARTDIESFARPWLCFSLEIGGGVLRLHDSDGTEVPRLKRRARPAYQYHCQ